MLDALLRTTHVLAIVVWVGGMTFAHFCLRPALAMLEPAARLRLMREVLGRFFSIVLVASLLTAASGVWMLGRVARQIVQAGGRFEMPLSWTVMTVLGLAMVAIFLYIRFVPYRALDRAVVAEQWAPAGAALGQVRLWVSVNLALGIAVLLVTLLGVGG